MNSVRNVLETKGYEIFAIAPNATTLAAVDEMCRQRVGALLVLDHANPIGIISERDLLRRVLLERRDVAKTRVEEIMTTGLYCVDPECSIPDAMATMTEHRCRHLPVVEERRLLGLVSIGDLVRWAASDQRFEIRMLHDYVEGRYPG